MSTVLYNEDLNSKALAHDIRGMLATVQLAVDRLMLHEDRLVRTQCALVERVIGKAVEYCADAVSDHRIVKEETISSDILTHDIELILKPLAETYDVDFNIVHIDFEIPVSIYMKLQRIIVNLSRNAITAQKHQSSGQLLVLLDAEDNNICVDIIDKGPGISSKTMDELHDQLNSPNPRAKKALGMGLTSSYVYVEELGGKINPVNTRATGTQFRIRIPLDSKTETHVLSVPEIS